MIFETLLMFNLNIHQGQILILDDHFPSPLDGFMKHGKNNLFFIHCGAFFFWCIFWFFTEFLKIMHIYLCVEVRADRRALVHVLNIKFAFFRYRET